MAYIGRGLDKISNVEKLDNITFDGSSTGFTLQKGGVNFVPSSANNILLSIDGVVQAGNFTCSGSTIDFGTAVSASSTCDFIIHYGVGVITTPSDNSVTAAKIPSGTISNSHLATTSINSQTAEATIAGDDEVLIYDTSASALRKMTRTNFVSGVGGDNTPAFSATLSTSQSASNSTSTIIVFNSEHFDTDSAYDTSNGRFTVPAGEGGKYVFNIVLRFDNATSNRNAVDIIINGSSSTQQVAFEGTGNQYNSIGGAIIMNLSAGDYVHAEYYQTSGGAVGVRADSHFSGYKLIGV